jgi:malonate transporter and related proteins
LERARKTSLLPAFPRSFICFDCPYTTRFSRYWQEILENPVLLATAGGTLFNLCGGSLPEMVILTLTRMGSASIALGLIMVGAGLRFTGLSEARGISAYFVCIKLIALPAITLSIGRWMELTTL